MIGAEDIPDAENGDVLRLMLAKGDSLQVARDIDFSVIFPDEAAAISFCRQVGSEEFRTQYEKSDVADYLPWDVTVTKHMVPQHRDITALEKHLESLASPLGGEVDGWSCFNVRDMPSA